MKSVLLSFVMIFSLQLTIGCSNDVALEQKTETEQIPVTEGAEPPTDNSIGRETPDPADTQQEITEPTEIGEGETEPPITDPPTETEPPTVTEPEEPETEDIEPVAGTAEILINELRTEYDATTRRVEFIEFKVKKSGSLQGIKLHTKWNSILPHMYNLPAINVKKGDYITYHLRTPENKCVNELGDNLSLSGGTDANSTARDLWATGNSKFLHNNDIVYLQDADGNVLDAIVLSETPGTAWSKSQQHFTGILEFLFNKGAWKSPNGELPNYLDAVDTSGIGANAAISVCRYENSEDTNTKADWYITAATPGEPNL